MRDDEMQKNQEVKSCAPATDGFDDAGDGGQGLRVIQGLKIGFTNDFTWVDGNDDVVPPELELVVVSLARVLQKWSPDNMPIRGTERYLAPGEHPDLEALNAVCTRAEWGKDFNDQPRAPWQVQTLVYLVDTKTMQRYTFPTATVGGNIAIDDLKSAVQLMRKFRGPHVYPVVALSDTFMNTRFGGRQRPSFKILRWEALDGDGALPPTTPTAALPPPSAEAEQTAEPAKGKGAKVKAGKGVRTVEPVSLHEELNDSLPENL
jgi:hypothetical protein